MTKLQEEFDLDRSSEVDAIEDPEEKGILATKIKQRRLGMIRFIGELYLRDMFKKKIIIHCFKNLFDAENPDEENIEELCKLIMTIGKKFSAKDSKTEVLKTQLSDMEALVTAGKITQSRVRFIIQVFICCAAVVNS